ncbi:MAG TPA: ATP-binding protein [Verrucomicrobiae bacterium]|jgi:signal transduction histidine kinase|nr:ATP-binding protein [Verrucomicrobiae bacterium]
MNLSVNFRLAALGMAAGLMGLLIVASIVLSQRQAEQLRLQLNTVDSESFGIAEHFKDSLRAINNIRFRYTADHDPAAWRQFLNSSRKLDDWLEQQAPKLLTTAHEKDELRQVKAAYEDYLADAEQMHSRDQAKVAPSEALAELSGARGQSQHLFDLGQELAAAHYESRNQLLASANSTLTQLRHLVLVLLASLFVLGVALAVLVYRDMVVPLQVKLVESQSLAEHHEKLASLGMLAAGVAHEIRNPLTAIKAAVFIQQKKFAPGSADAADAELVGREILRLERIVTEFLQFARPAEPVLANLPAQLPLREVQRFLAPELAKKNIRLLLEDSNSLTVKVDGEQMKQVLINLVQNAADSIGHDGAITLRCRPGRKSLTNGETDVVILEVADTGRGIAPEVEKRLFDPFFTTKPEGTGLGLSIAACIIQKHGGALQYQTQVNRGTTFGIILPRSAT